MQRRGRSVVLWLVLVFVGLASPAAAQVKPYFLVIADTSTSMSWCSGGELDNACDGDTNRCGYPANRLGDAKCALRRIVDGVGGDADFALMQFKHPCRDGCPAETNPSSAACGGVNSTYNDGQLVATFSDDVREWVDGSCPSGSSCSGGNYRPELTAEGFTPLARSLERANEYLRGSFGGGFLYRNSTSPPAAPLTPLVNDETLRCTPVSVILLTDGDDTCANNPTTDPPSRAAVLNTGAVDGDTPANKAFRTYVIGFGTGGNFNPTVLNNIASMGGTDEYLAAANEAELSAALNQIIADAQPPVEVCNERDDDCDDKIDEGIQKYCDRSMGITDLVLCDERPETACDGIDDDCDGTLDEGLTNVCGSCGDVPAEACDGVDNDCDTRVDESASTLDACGSDVGECKAGQLVCVEGMERCEGAIGPTDELCDCKDNDCDGNTDEEVGESLCGGEMRCAGCKCVQYCDPVQEFGQTCPPGLAPDTQPSGECLCVEDNCDREACDAKTIESGGDLQCAPEDETVGSCICRAGTCVGRCAGVTCQSNYICDPQDGNCVENNCRGLGCASGQRCDPSSGECVKDTCASADCAADEVCRDGTCEKSCQGIRCQAGETCKSGACVEDKCTDVRCNSGDTCHPDSGECVVDPCSTLSCPSGRVCSVASGECEADPCWNVTCPSGQSCSHGECGKGAPPTRRSGVSGGEAGGSGTDAPTEKYFAAGGGGGCACSVPGPAPLRGPSPGWSLMLLAGAAALRLRRRRAPSARFGRAGISLLIAGALSLLMGCKVSPLCLACEADASSIQAADTSVPDDSGGPRGGSSDAGGDLQDAEPMAGDGGDAGDAGPPTDDSGRPQCTPSGPETCDGKDEDCDFKVDEDVVAADNDCKQRGVCAGTAPVCVSGEFACRYENDYEEEESRCDGKDNDCDGDIDEPFAELGASCQIGVGACRVTGTRQCNTAQNGLICVVAETKEPSQELCNNIDDDCDGTIDEPKSAPGTNPSYVVDDVVRVASDIYIYKYEASRADAAPAAGGIVANRACSRAGVLPWTNVTYDEAIAACAASDMALCDADDWVRACRGDSQNCGWSYTSNCTTYSAGTCNGEGDSGALEATGASAECKVAFGSAGEIFDMSGNVKEWTNGGDSPEFNPLRGGSYNNTGDALRCDFDFSVAKRDHKLPNIGFRCCSSTAP